MILLANHSFDLWKARDTWFLLLAATLLRQNLPRGLRSPGAIFGKSRERWWRDATKTKSLFLSHRHASQITAVRLIVLFWFVVTTMPNNRINLNFLAIKEDRPIHILKRGFHYIYGKLKLEIYFVNVSREEVPWVEVTLLFVGPCSVQIAIHFSRVLKNSVNPTATRHWNKVKGKFGVSSKLERLVCHLCQQWNESVWLWLVAFSRKDLIFCK